VSLQHQVWAMAYLDAESEDHLRAFLASRPEIVTRRIRQDFHVTIYHARRSLPGLLPYIREIDVRLPVAEMRFMPLVPGGENPRNDIDPTQAPVGLRIRRGPGRSEIETLRAEFYAYETVDILGQREPSSPKSNAFGARHYQPHLTITRPGGVTVRDLRPIGEALRSHLEWLRLDRLCVELRQREAAATTYS
jgi:hypothetical protein